MCRAHATVRELLGALVGENRELAVVDLEAGLENLSRGTPRHADVLLIVLEPYFKSLETGRRILELARELGIQRIYGVANKIRSQEDEAAIRDFARYHQVDLSATVLDDEGILSADRQGRSPVDVAPDSPAVRAVHDLAQSL